MHLRLHQSLFSGGELKFTMPNNLELPKSTDVHSLSLLSEIFGLIPPPLVPNSVLPLLLQPHLIHLPLHRKPPLFSGRGLAHEREVEILEEYARARRFFQRCK